MARSVARRKSRTCYPVASEIQRLEERILPSGTSTPEVVQAYHVSDGEEVSLAQDRRALRSVDVALTAQSVYEDQRSSRTEGIEAQASVAIRGRITGRVDTFTVTTETTLVASEATGIGFFADGTLREATATVIVSGWGTAHLQIEAHAATSRHFETTVGGSTEIQLETERASAHYLLSAHGRFSFVLTVSARGEAVEYGGNLATEGRVQRDTASVQWDASATRFSSSGVNDTNVSDFAEYIESDATITVASHALSSTPYFAHGSGPFSATAAAEQVRVLAYSADGREFVRENHYAGTGSVESTPRVRSQAVIEAGSAYDGVSRHSWLYYYSHLDGQDASNTALARSYSFGDEGLLDLVFSDADLVAGLLFA